MNDAPNNSPETVPQHYYGDIVRYLFLLAAVMMLVGLPAVSQFLLLPPFISVIAILILGLAAGLTNPKQTWTAAVNAGLATIGFLVFGLYAVYGYQIHSVHSKFFAANLALAFIFLFTVYFSVKTLRGMVLKN